MAIFEDFKVRAKDLKLFFILGYPREILLQNCLHDATNNIRGVETHYSFISTNVLRH